MLRIAINGFGRIGRSVLRIAAKMQDVEIALINDVVPTSTCAYLFQYDSVFGPWPGHVSYDDTHIIVDGTCIPFSRAQNIGSCDMRDVHVLFECTGSASAYAFAKSGLAAGARHVLISAPEESADITLVLGANDEVFAGQRIISIGSCTTNALAPILRVLDEQFGIVGGHMTTVHCYTGSQPTVDQARPDLARSRAAALSMVPTTTSAHRTLERVLPSLARKIEARALRVPTASVSALDLVVMVRDLYHETVVKSIICREASRSAVLGWLDQPLVSVDLRGRPESLIISGQELSLSECGLLRVFGWYDNEWGFSNRMLDVAMMIADRHN